jgi:hypothetical protein
MTSSPPSQKPVHEIRFGNIRAAIWLNQHGEITRHNVTITRLYKDGDKWKHSDSFGREDLPKVTLVTQKAYEWIFTAAPATE